MPTYWSFFVTFFRIGLFTVGGGYVMLPMIEDEVVDKKKWINKGDFLDLLAVAQTVPGVFAVNMSINIGYRLRKVPGALACALGCVLPSFLMILAIALFFHQFEKYRLSYVLRIRSGTGQGQGQPVDGIFILMEQPQNLFHVLRSFPRFEISLI